VIGHPAQPDALGRTRNDGGPGIFVRPEGKRQAAPALVMRNRMVFIFAIELPVRMEHRSYEGFEGYTMGRITEDVKFETSFDFPKDREFLCKKAKHASAMSTRRYLFVGETHNSEIDKKRTYAVADFCRFNPEVVIIAERNILAEEPYLELSRNVIHEKDRASSPFAPGRNRSIVEQIVEEIKKDGGKVDKEERIKKQGWLYNKPRMVLILFGQDHEQHIRCELQAQTEKDERLCWWSFPSPADALSALNWATYPSQEGYSFQGFVSRHPDDEAQKELLAKGKFVNAFNVGVTAPWGPGRGFNGEYYALYTSDAVDPQKKIRGDLDSGNLLQQPVFAVHSAISARLVRIENQMQFETLKTEAAEW
jgi:hypothetical protein